LNTAAEAAVGYLDFSGVGEGNLTGFIQQFARREELPRIDVATLLIQSQRADAAAAVMQAAIGKPAFTNTVWVLRWYSDKGTPQDYRIDITDARKQRYVQVNQRVLMRVLLMETLRGMRSVQACVLAAQMPRIDDIEVPEIGRQFVASTGPQFPDDEIVLITELARETPRRRSGLWRKDPVQAVRALGRCAHHIEEAMAVAKVLASRPDPPPRRGKRRRDPIKEAAKAAMRELARAKVERDRKVSEELRRIREALE